MQKQFLICSVAFIVLLTSSFSVALDSFETLPSNWDTYSGGSISTSTDHYKDGSKSLKWDFSSGSYLRADSPTNLYTAGTNGTGGIIIWIYNENPVDANATLLFGDQTEILNGTCKYKIDFGLNFTGWRCGWIDFHEDAQNPSWTSDTSMDWFYIKSPSSTSGTIYLDMVDFVDHMVWDRTRDYQLPTINSTHQLSFHHWQHTYKWSQQQPIDSPPATITQDQIDDFNTIKQRYEDFLLGTGSTNNSIVEDFETTSTVNIDDNGSSNETTQISDSSGFCWGGYNAASGGKIQFQDKTTDDRLRFRPQANVSGSYAYTIFDSSGGTSNPQEIAVESISYSATGSGLVGTDIRLMVRSASDSTWYYSDALAAKEDASIKVDDIQWHALYYSTNNNLNQLADYDEDKLYPTGASGSFSEMVGTAIDGGGIYIENGTENYFNINSIQWGKIDITEKRMISIQNFISNGLAEYENYTIIGSGSNIKGTPLFGRNSEYSPKVGEEFAETVMLALALDYRINGNTESKDKYLKCLDHLYDQGWAEGSSMGALDHQMNQEAGWVNSIFLMWDSMTYTQKEYSWKALDWYAEFGEVYARPFHHSSTTADRYQCTEIPRLIRMLLMPNSPEKVRDMNNYIEWLSNAYGTGYGWADTIKPDYSGWHHLGIQGNAYAPVAFHAGAAVIYMLDDTQFSVKQNAIDNVENALMSYRTYLNKYDMNPGIGGRSATTGEDALVSVIPAYAYLAATKDDIANSELAKAFKRVYDIYYPAVLSEMTSCSTTAGKMWVRTLGSNEIVQQIADSNAVAENAPTGTFNYNCSALLSHRRDDWMASVKGWSKYVLNYENPGRNELGWNQSSGCLQIYTSEGRIANGTDLNNGWDWNRYPGTTAVNISESSIASKASRMFTTEGFVGGTNLDEQNGLFAMKLYDNLYGLNLSAKKSYFFFDDIIICLGSDITETSSSASVETTLFQGKLTNQSDAIYDNSTTPVTSFPYSNSHTTSSIWLMDAFDNGYYIPANQTIQIRKQTQNTTDKDGSGTTNGDYATAWLEHGTGSSNQDYEYAVKAQSTPSETQAFAAAPSYQVLQKNSDAHIVKDNITETTGYAVFGTNQQFAFGKIENIDSPSLVMAQKPDYNHFNLSICDPDLHIDDGGNSSQDTGGVKSEDIYYNKSQKSNVNITLKGKWRIADKIGIKESFNTASDITIDNSGSSNETLQTSGATGYRWGGYNAAASGNVQLDDQDGGRLRFRLAANTQGSYAYSIFDEKIAIKSVNFEGGARGLEGTYIRLMLRSSDTEKWFISEPVEAEEFVAVNVRQTLWAEIDSAVSSNLNLLADGDETAITTTGDFQYFEDSIGMEIDGGGFCIETGTDDYFAIDEPTWSSLESGLYAEITDSNLAQTTIQAQCYYGKTINLNLINSTSFTDFAEFTLQWLKNNCGQCGGADLNGDTKVDMKDLRIFADSWLYAG